MLGVADARHRLGAVRRLLCGDLEKFQGRAEQRAPVAGRRFAKQRAPALEPWEDRLTELGGELDDLDELFIEVDGAAAEGGDVEVARGQLELFGTLLSSLAGSKAEAPRAPEAGELEAHEVLTRDGRQLTGSWEDIVRSLQHVDAEGGRDVPLEVFMSRMAKRTFRETGVRVPSHDVELFVRAHADAGLLRIVQ